MHHKRKRPKSTRCGCLLCKPHKRQGSKLADRQKHSQYRKMVVAGEKVEEVRCG